MESKCLKWHQNMYGIEKNEKEDQSFPLLFPKSSLYISFAAVLFLYLK